MVVKCLIIPNRMENNSLIITTTQCTKIFKSDRQMTKKNVENHQSVELQKLTSRPPGLCRVGGVSDVNLRKGTGAVRHLRTYINTISRSTIISRSNFFWLYHDDS